MASLGLIEGEYIFSHVAANMPVDTKVRSKVDKDGGHFHFEGDMRKFAIRLSNNAIDCGHFLFPCLLDSHHLTFFRIAQERNQLEGMRV